MIGAYDAVRHVAIPRLYAACKSNSKLSESVIKRTGRNHRRIRRGVGEEILARVWMLSVRGEIFEGIQTWRRLSENVTTSISTRTV